MTAYLARTLRFSLLFILTALLSLTASAETLIIVPADESGSTSMTRDIAKAVVIPIMKAGKHTVIPYKNYRKAALDGGIEASGLSSEAAMAEHGPKLGATKGIEVKVMRKGAKAEVKVVDLAAKVVVYEKALSIAGANLTGAEGKTLVARIYEGLIAKPAPQPEPAAPAAQAAPEPVPAEATTVAKAEQPTEPAPTAPVTTPAANTEAATPAPEADAGTQAEAPQVSEAPKPAEPELELKLEDATVETSNAETAAPPDSPATTTAEAEPTISTPQMVTLRAGNKALYFSSAISDGSTEDLKYATNAFVPGIAVGATFAPANLMDVPDWAKHLTLGFTINPILVQPQAYSTTGDATLVTNWSLELGYAPRALTEVPDLAIGAFAHVSSFSMPVGLGGFPDVGIQMLETGVVARYDAGDILTIEDIVKGLKFEATATLGLGLGVDETLDVLGDAGMTLGYGISLNAQTTVFDFFQVGSELGYASTSTSFSGASTLAERREQFNDASLSSSYLTFQLFARKSFL